MVIDDTKEFCYFSLMKTGCHTIHQWLAATCPNCYVLVGQHGSYAELYNNHLEVYNKVKNYVNFTFIRNPYSHAVSLYFHILDKDRWYVENYQHVNGIENFKDFNYFLEHVYYPQENYTLNDKKFICNRWCMFENFEDECKSLSETVGIPEMSKNLLDKKVNSTKNRKNVLNLEYPDDYRTMYNDQGIEIVLNKSKQIIEKFNYKF